MIEFKDEGSFIQVTPESMENKNFRQITQEALTDVEMGRVIDHQSVIKWADCLAKVDFDNTKKDNIFKL